MELDKDFNEFVELFIAHDVQFLIIGGYALRRTRFTESNRRPRRLGVGN